MTESTWAALSDYSVFSALLVLSGALVGYVVHLARTVPREDTTSDGAMTSAPRVTQQQLVDPAGAPTPDGECSGPALVGVATTHGPDHETGRPDPGPARRASGIAWMLTLLGTALVVAGVVLRALDVHRWPLGNMYEFALAGAMFTLLAYIAWSTRRDLRWLGAFVLAPVLAVLGSAVTIWYTEASQLMPSLRSYWLAVHVTVATMTVAVFTLGAALGALYLIQDRIETGGSARARRSFMSRLPTAQALERLAYAAHVVAFPMWTFTVIAGAIWARQAWGSYWNWDPKEVWSFVIWVAYAAYLHARATTGWRRQNATWIALAGFGAVIFNFAVVNVFIVGMHSYSGL
ncbi:MAG: c-type cytochrome biogenesis protein CcsB [Micrococcales bacterium]|nr:c-type cytochrome biogenesis protein CcsB [Micrococcales bacterium]